MNLGETIKGLRESIGKSQQKMADELGISKSAWNMYERGERIPRDKVKILIADYFGMTVQEIFMRMSNTNSA